MDAVIRSIDAVVALVGKTVSVVVVAMTGIIIFEMTTRGLFGVASPWAYDLSGWLLATYIFLGGAYALQQNRFVRVDILYTRFRPRTRALIDATIGTVLFVLFAGTLLRLGSDFALRSIEMREVSATGAWQGPVYVAKTMLPIGVLLLCLAWLSHVLKLLRDAFAPQDR